MRVVRSQQLSAWPQVGTETVRRRHVAVVRRPRRSLRLGDQANPEGLAEITTPSTGQGASGTGPTAPLATNTSNANGALSAIAAPVPADLEFVLDNATALLFRQYAALNPEDFQNWLNRYADYIRMRQDFYFQAVTNPPAAGYELTPTMAVSLGSAAYRVVQGLNGVAAGRYGDLFGITSTIAGQIPGIDPNVVTALQGLTLGYRAVSAVITGAQIFQIAAANGVSVLNLTSTMLESGVQGAVAAQVFGTEAVGAVSGSLATAPIASFGGVLMAVGLAVDIGFTIAGDAPDIQKAIDVALDVASLVCLFIPVIGWVIAIVIQVVKFIIDLFGEDLFGGGMSHEQRELLETARYSERLSPMFPELAAAYTPRELWATIVAWGSGYCGGAHNVAMGVNLILKAGDQMMVGGRPYTIPPDTQNPYFDTTYGGTTLGFGRQPCYWLANTPFRDMTDDEQAWALGRYATQNGIVAMAQAGIAEDKKVQFNRPTADLIQARAATMARLLGHGYTLDQIDWIVAEYRAQPALNAFAQRWGWPNWQAMLGDLLQDEWQGFLASVPHGTLTDFARARGYATMSAYRTGAFGSYRAADDRLAALEARVAAIERWYVPARAAAAVEQELLWQQASAGAP